MLVEAADVVKGGNGRKKADEKMESVVELCGQMPNAAQKLIEERMEEGNRDGAHAMGCALLAARHGLVMKAGEEATAKEMKEHRKYGDDGFKQAVGGDFVNGAFDLGKYIRLRNERINHTLPAAHKELRDMGKGDRVMCVYGSYHSNLGQMFAESNRDHEVWSESGEVDFPNHLLTSGSKVSREGVKGVIMASNFARTLSAYPTNKIEQIRLEHKSSSK
jgi:hypothetical protein